jgi:hypothetical protein
MKHGHALNAVRRWSAPNGIKPTARVFATTVPTVRKWLAPLSADRHSQRISNVFAFAIDVSFAVRDPALPWFPWKNEFTAQQILIHHRVRHIPRLRKLAAPGVVASLLPYGFTSVDDPRLDEIVGQNCCQA